eukprot:scaffold165816_cov37-Prasinocladus_malaysianus.AAC.1
MSSSPDYICCPTTTHLSNLHNNLQNSLEFGLDLDGASADDLTWEVVQVEVDQPDDVRTDGVQEGPVVRDHQDDGVRVDLLGQPALQPQDGGEVEVVGGLVQHQQGRAHEQGPS